MCSDDSADGDRDSAGSGQPCPTQASAGGCDEPVDIVDVSFPTRITYAEDLSVRVTLRNRDNTEQSRRIRLYGESYGRLVSLTQATVYVPRGTTVEHELTTLAAPAGLSELFIPNSEFHSPITVTPIQATVGDQIPCSDGTVLHLTTVEQTDDATALYIDVIEQGRNGPPDRLRFTEKTQTGPTSAQDRVTQSYSAWNPLYTQSETGGWLIFLPQTQKVILREEGQQAIISLSE